MDGADLLRSLRFAGLTVTAEAEKLRVSPKEKLTNELREKIHANKPALLAALGIVEIWDFQRVTLTNGERWIEGTRLGKPGSKRWRTGEQGATGTCLPPAQQLSQQKEDDSNGMLDLHS